MKCLMAIVLLIFAAPAFAQTIAPGTETPAPLVSPNPPVSTPANNFVTHQTQEQWLVGNVWGKRVYNAAGQGIGDVKDVLIGRDGKVAAVVVGVGGFLGLGEKNVAVDFDFLQKNGTVGGDRIVIGMNEQDLRAAPDFQRIKPAASTSPSSTRTQ